MQNVKCQFCKAANKLWEVTRVKNKELIQKEKSSKFLGNKKQKENFVIDTKRNIQRTLIPPKRTLLINKKIKKPKTISENITPIIIEDEEKIIDTKINDCNIENYQILKDSEQLEVNDQKIGKYY